MKTRYLLFLIVLILFSCGKKEVKPGSQESKAAVEAFALAETIKDAFLNDEKDTLRRNSTAEGYEDITANRKDFDTVTLTFKPRWVEIENGKVTLNIAWTSVWTSAGGKSEDRGMAVFILEGSPLKVSKILRGNPFIYPNQ